MNNQDLLDGLKDNLLIPKDVDVFDQILKTYLLGAKSYINSVLDQIPEPDDMLYKLSIVFLAGYYFQNRDNPKLKYAPCTIDGIINRLQNKYHE